MFACTKYTPRLSSDDGALVTFDELLILKLHLPRCHNIQITLLCTSYQALFWLDKNGRCPCTARSNRGPPLVRSRTILKHRLKLDMSIRRVTRFKRKLEIELPQWCCHSYIGLWSLQRRASSSDKTVRYLGLRILACSRTFERPIRWFFHLR